MLDVRSWVRLFVSLPPAAGDVERFIKTMRIDAGTADKRTFLQRNEGELARLIHFVNGELAMEHGKPLKRVTRDDYWIVFNCEADLLGHAHDEGEKGILPLPSNIKDWNGPSAPAWDDEMSIECNLFHYALYIGEIKNKRTMSGGLVLYARLFEAAAIQGNTTRAAKLCAGIIHGYFGSSAYTGTKPAHEVLMAAYARDEPLSVMLEATSFKKKFALTGRERNIEAAIGWLAELASEQKREVIRDGLIYSSASTSAPGTLVRKGTIVLAIAEAEGWVEVTHGATRGFMRPALLAPLATS